MNVSDQVRRRRASERGGLALDRLIDNLPGIAYRSAWTGTWRMLFLSAACRRITGYAPSDLVGEGRWEDVIHPDDRRRVRQEVAMALIGGSHFETSYRIRIADGSERWFRDEGCLSEIGNDGTAYIDGFMSDHTLYKQTERSLRDANRAIDRLIREDPLTGLSNRRELDEQLPRAISLARRWKQPLGVILADLDHFKNINDNFGHLAGDQVLVAFSELLRTSCRLEDLAVRFGGDEFLLVLPNSSSRRCTALADRLRQQLRQVTLPVATRVTASFGVTVVGDQDTRESLLRRADRALYLAKRAGRDRLEILSGEDSSAGGKQTPASGRSNPR